MSMPEPSRCMWAAIMAGFFICMPAMGLPLLLSVRKGTERMEFLLQCVRSVIHCCCPLKVIRSNTICHASPHQSLILGIHGVVHHHALVPLFVLHVGKVLLFTSAPCCILAYTGLTRVC